MTITKRLTSSKKYKLIIAVMSFSLTSVLYTNCSFPNFSAMSNSANLQNPSSSNAEVSCGLPTGPISVNSSVTGYASSTAIFPSMCGAQVSRTCLSSGQFDGSVPLSPTCSQKCVNPDNQQAVSVGTSYVYYTIANAATQAECDAASVKIVSTCQASTGQFFPLPPVNRFTTCKVQGQVCAYATAPGYATPTGNQVGATVTGYAAQSMTYPNLCGSQITETCAASGSWGGAIPLYSACAQSCFDSAGKMAYGQGQGPSYYSISSGTQTQCANALVPSKCQPSGLFVPAIPVTNFSTCSIVTTPPPTWTISPEPSFVIGQITTTDLSTTLPAGIVKGGIFSVDLSGATLPQGMTLSPAGILSLGGAAVGSTSGVVFSYTEP